MDNLGDNMTTDILTLPYFIPNEDLEEIVLPAARSGDSNHASAAIDIFARNDRMDLVRQLCKESIDNKARETAGLWLDDYEGALVLHMLNRYHKMGVSTLANIINADEGLIKLLDEYWIMHRKINEIHPPSPANFVRKMLKPFKEHKLSSIRNRISQYDTSQLPQRTVPFNVFGDEWGYMGPEAYALVGSIGPDNEYSEGNAVGLSARQCDNLGLDTGRGPPKIWVGIGDRAEKAEVYNLFGQEALDGPYVRLSERLAKAIDAGSNDKIILFQRKI